jgi:hypothetical protein
MEMRNAHKIFITQAEGKRPHGICEMIILKLILKEPVAKVRAGFNLFRTGQGSWVLGTRCHKRYKIS